MTVLFAPEAEADFAALIGYLAERNPSAAAKLGQRIFEVIDRLAAEEYQGPETALANGERVNSWPVPPFRIYYQRTPTGLWILRIYHQARR